MVNIISDELLEDLNNGKVVNLEFGPLTISLANSKWVEKQKELGNIKEIDEYEKEFKDDKKICISNTYKNILGKMLEDK